MGLIYSGTVMEEAISYIIHLKYDPNLGIRQKQVSFTF